MSPTQFLFAISLLDVLGVMEKMPAGHQSLKKSQYKIWITNVASI